MTAKSNLGNSYKDGWLSLQLSCGVGKTDRHPEPVAPEYESDEGLGPRVNPTGLTTADAFWP